MSSFFHRIEPKTTAATNTAPFFQAKLTVNTPGDAHEREADLVADRVMRMQDDEEPVAQRMSLTPVSGVQRMCVECEEKEKEKLQRTESAGGKSGGHTAPSIVSQVLSSGGGRPIDTGTRQFMENRFGQDFGQVRIHTDIRAAASAAAIQAKAYTSGNNIVFGSGEYRPESGGGRRLLAHELAHVGQQQGGSGEIRRFVEDSYMASNGKPAPARYSDDDTMVVNQKNLHRFYAKPGKAAASNKALNAVGSEIELYESGTSATFTSPSTGKSLSLKRVLPKNKTNATKGVNMELWADCGKSNSVVVGGMSRRAVFTDKGKTQKTAPGSPDHMKIAVIANWLQQRLLTADATESAKIVAAYKNYANLAKQAETALKAGDSDLYWAKISQAADALLDFYYNLPDKEREQVDKSLGINKYATPGVGQGYTISSGGAPVPGKRTWNFHWGGVVMVSDDNRDRVVLENYATGVPDEQNKDWEFQMYGPADKKGQTFHEQHKDTGQHGKRPTTMTIEKNP